MLCDTKKEIFRMKHCNRGDGVLKLRFLRDVIYKWPPLISNNFTFEQGFESKFRIIDDKLSKSAFLETMRTSNNIYDIYKIGFLVKRKCKI